MGAEADGAGDRRDAGAGGGAGGGVFREGVRHHVSRARRDRRRRCARARSMRFSLAAMLALVALCVLCGILPGFVIDALARRRAATGRRTHAGRRATSHGCRSFRSRRRAAPIIRCSSSCSSRPRRWLSAIVVHRWASRAVRRGPAWDCGFPDPSPQTEYTAAQLCPADPARVRDAGVPGARERGHAGRPARCGRRALRSVVRDLIWDVAVRADLGSRSAPSRPGSISCSF